MAPRNESAPPGAGTAREEVLARIRAALGTGGGGRPGDAASEVPRGYRASAELGTSALASLLIDRLHDYGTAVRRCPAGGIAQAVREALAERGARRVVVPPGLGLDGAVLAGVTLLADDGLPPGTLDAADGVITRAAVAIAETGTIILDGGPGQGRRALSLVPDYHLCILDTGQIVGIVPQALGRLDPARPCTWISGPSATSDIELERVQGVHGPRTLEVILAGP
jgi:L-lactate dehydrogenase complex protein LldG